MFLHYYFSFSGDPTGTICPPDMFRCPEGKCIPLGKVCNYQKDCEKAEDELQSCRKYLHIYISVFFFVGFHNKQSKNSVN